MLILEKIAEFIAEHWRVFGCAFIIIGVGVYENYEGYQEGLAVLERYKADQVKLVKDAELLKLAKEQKDAKHTQEIITAYDASVASLAKRLRDIQNMSGKRTVLLDGTGRPIEAVPEVPNTTGRVNATFEAKSPPSLSIEPADALGDTLQCEKLQEWVKGTYYVK